MRQGEEQDKQQAIISIHLCTDKPIASLGWTDGGFEDVAHAAISHPTITGSGNGEAVLV